MRYSVAMEESLDRIFVDFSQKKLRQLTARIQDCLGRLTAEQIWARGHENENAIGNLVLHLCGNVRQWIIAGVGGKPDIRERDREFTARGNIQPAELSERLKMIVEEAAAVIDAAGAARLAQHVTIQKYDIPVMEAIAHVVEHFAQHTGQIIFATKMLTGQDLGYYKHLKTTAAHGEKTP
jgi:uncharacterized damage-inducible protein DinB